jgi:pimeloyl-ACP methyl ester carboxylesterase
VLDLMDAPDLERADVVGDSFGGALALALAIRAPQPARRLVLMGSVGVPFTLVIERVAGARINRRAEHARHVPGL